MRMGGEPDSALATQLLACKEGMTLRWIQKNGCFSLYMSLNELAVIGDGSLASGIRNAPRRGRGRTNRVCGPDRERSGRGDILKVIGCERKPPRFAGTGSVFGPAVRITLQLIAPELVFAGAAVQTADVTAQVLAHLKADARTLQVIEELRKLRR